MAAYLTGSIQVTELAAYEEYKNKAPATVFQYGGRYLTKPDTTRLVTGSCHPGRFVILEFPSMEQLLAWWNSPEYQPLKELRERSSTSNILITEGLE